jgi:hypothetical protein
MFGGYHARMEKIKNESDVEISGGCQKPFSSPLVVLKTVIGHNPSRHFTKCRFTIED